MMWQPNAAQPVAYAPAYNQGYAPVQTDGEFSSEAWIVACFAIGAAADTARTRCLQSVERSPMRRRRRSARRGLAACSAWSSSARSRQQLPSPLWARTP